MELREFWFEFILFTFSKVYFSIFYLFLVLVDCYHIRSYQLIAHLNIH